MTEQSPVLILDLAIEPGGPPAAAAPGSLIFDSATGDARAFLQSLHAALAALFEGRIVELPLRSHGFADDGRPETVSLLLGRSTDSKSHYAALQGFALRADELQSFAHSQYQHWTLADEPARLESLLPLIHNEKTLASACALNIDDRREDSPGAALHAWLRSIALTAQSVHRRVLPAGRKHDDHYTIPPGYILYKERQPWICGGGQSAAASCTLLSGGQFSVVHIRESATERPRRMEPTAYLFPFSAATTAELSGLLQNYISRLKVETPDLPALARTLAAQSPGACRVAIVAANAQELSERLQKAVTGIAKTPRSPARFKYNLVWNVSGTMQPRIAGVLPGQGAQRTGMLRDLCIHFPAVRSWFDDLETALLPVSGILPSLTLFPPDEGPDPEQREQLLRNLYSQEGGSAAVIVSSIALNDLLGSFGCVPDVLVGHSSGEISAMIISGALHFDTRQELFDTIRSINHKGAEGDARGEIPKGKFLAVTTPDESLLEGFIDRHKGEAYLAMDNCPQQRVVFFTDESYDRLHRELVSLGAICLPLYFDRAYHTELFEVEMPSIRAVYDSFHLRPPRVPVFNCIRLGNFPHDAEAMKEWACLNWTHCVRFREACQQLSEEGIQFFLEIGPGGVLSGFVDNTLNSRPHKALPLDQEGHDGYVQFLNVLANLFVEGVNPDLGKLFEEDKSVIIIQQIEAGPPAATNITAMPMRNSQAVRAALVQEHMAFMNEYLAMESRLLAGVVGRSRRPSARPVPAPMVPSTLSLPLIDSIVSRTAHSCTSRRVLARATDLFLQHHTLGRFILKKPKEAAPLPVMPLAMTIEMLAEAASLLAPQGFVVSAITDLKALRWLTVDDESLSLLLESTLKEHDAAGRHTVEVQVLEEGAEDEPYCTATVILQSAYPAAPSPLPFEASVPETVAWDAESFFEQCLFHGEAFSCMDKLLRIGSEEIELKLSVPEKNMLFAGDAAPQFLTPAQLLDVPGHGTAYWQVEMGDRLFGTFPFFIGRIDFFGPPPAPHQSLTGRGRNRISGTLIDSSFELLQPDGSVLMKISDLKLVYYRFESSFLKSHYWTSAHTYYSNELAVDHPDVIGFEAQSLSRDFLNQSGGLWLRSLVHMFCNPKEKQEWNALPSKGWRREQWLLGRIAAKEIVRKWALHYHFIYILCPDIGIVYDEDGRPFAVCPELERLGPLPDISITHSGPQAIALATNAGHRIGVDLEYFGDDPGKDSPELNERLRIAFGDEELEKLGTRAATDLYALTCAKEAASKAVGTGFLGRMKLWKIKSYVGSTVLIDAQGDELEVRLERSAGRILAWCLVPEAVADRIKTNIKTAEPA